MRKRAPESLQGRGGARGCEAYGYGCLRRERVQGKVKGKWREANRPCRLQIMPSGVMRLATGCCPPEEACAIARAHKRRSAQKAQEEDGSSVA